MKNIKYHGTKNNGLPAVDHRAKIYHRVGNCTQTRQLNGTYATFLAAYYAIDSHLNSINISKRKIAKLPQ